MTHVTVWMHLKDTVLSEISQTQKVLYGSTCVKYFSSPGHADSMQSEGRQAWREGKTGSQYLMGDEFQLEKVQKCQGGMVGSDGCTTVRMYLLSLNCTHKHGQDGTLYVMCILPQQENIYTESVSPRDEQTRKMSADFTLDCACQGEESKCFPCFLIKQLVIT